MSIFSSYKKIFLLGFIVVILIAIPFSVYIAQKRQQTISKASASTTLSFEPPSPIIEVGTILKLDIVLDPGTGETANQVSFVKLIINFDPSKFTTVSDSLVPNPSPPNTLTSILEDPVYESGKASISLSIGADPIRVVTTKTTIAILKLKALSTADANNPSSIIFDNGTQVLSIAGSDQTSENVLSTTTPATVTITDVSRPASISEPSTPTPTPTVTTTPSESLPMPVPDGKDEELIRVEEEPLQITDLGAETIPIEDTLTITPRPSQDLSIESKAGLPPTGPSEKILGIGILGAILTIIGGALFIFL